MRTFLILALCLGAATAFLEPQGGACFTAPTFDGTTYTPMVYKHDQCDSDTTRNRFCRATTAMAYDITIEDGPCGINGANPGYGTSVYTGTAQAAFDACEAHQTAHCVECLITAHCEPGSFCAPFDGDYFGQTVTRGMCVGYGQGKAHKCSPAVSFGNVEEGLNSLAWCGVGIFDSTTKMIDRTYPDSSETSNGVWWQGACVSGWCEECAVGEPSGMDYQFYDYLGIQTKTCKSRYNGPGGIEEYVTDWGMDVYNLNQNLVGQLNLSILCIGSAFAIFFFYVAVLWLHDRGKCLFCNCCCFGDASNGRCQSCCGGGGGSGSKKKGGDDEAPAGTEESDSE